MMGFQLCDSCTTPDACISDGCQRANADAEKWRDVIRARNNVIEQQEKAAKLNGE